ncbi:hypothetical protein MRX96_054670 [Rhipicephalus microplus]
MIGRYMTEKGEAGPRQDGLLDSNVLRPADGAHRSEREEECEDDAPHVSATEKRLLRNEFMNTMYESFLSGKDKDYDYESVDNNADFDSLQTRQHDEEEKYFDAEEPGDFRHSRMKRFFKVRDKTPVTWTCK